MRNSNQPPPKYGAEGPPGGVEAWNRQRFAPPQQQQGMAGLGQMVRGMVERQRGPQAGPPQGGMRPWDQVGQAQWPGQGGGPPQGMPPQAQGAPPMGGQMPGGAPPMENVEVTAPRGPSQMDAMQGQMGQMQKQQQFAQLQAQAKQPTASQRLMQQSRALRPRGVRTQEY